MSKHKLESKSHAAKSPGNHRRDEGVKALAEQPQSGLLRELASMILQNKKWWLIPIMVTLLALGLIVFLGGTAAAPLIYTLF